MKLPAGIPLAVLALWLALSGTSQAYQPSGGFADASTHILVAGDDDDRDDDDDDDDRDDDDDDDDD